MSSVNHAAAGMDCVVLTELGKSRRAVDKLTKTGNYFASVTYLGMGNEKLEPPTTTAAEVR